VAGRRQERLKELVQTGEKMGGRLDGICIDLTEDTKQLKEIVGDIIEKYPQVNQLEELLEFVLTLKLQLDTIIFSSGIQNPVDFTNPETVPVDREFHHTSHMCTIYTGHMGSHCG
jgi:short-subunit dehydrogenase involved in D-alanine esterification of teichoic acids